MANSRREPPDAQTSRRRTRKNVLSARKPKPAAIDAPAELDAAGDLAGPHTGGELRREIREISGPETPRKLESRRRELEPVDPRSLLFDPAWYLSQYSDVANARLDPAQHFLEHGGFEGRDPNPFFSTRFYCENNPDVVGSGMNPFLHYVIHGAREGRSPRGQD